MSFRKKNISILPTRGAPISASKAPDTGSSPGITSTSGTASSTTPASNPVTAPTVRLVPGVRPSPISGHPTTSTGTPSLDALLSGHAGLPLGSSLLVEESGTTDFGGALLRYYASEGIVQGHHVIVVGMGEHWARELPAAVGSAGADEQKEGEVKKERERMKIAWRYERLAAGGSGGGVAAGLGSKRGIQPQQQEGLPGVHSDNNTHGGLPSATAVTEQQGPFCHSFDLTKRLEISPETKISYIPLIPSLPHLLNSNSPFIDVLSRLNSILKTSPLGTIHRLVIPNLLSPALYPPHACLPNHLIQFMHSLRALLRAYYTSLTAMISFPLELYPRTIGLVRWVEILTDTVVELVPVASLMERAAQAAAKGREDVPMGLVRVWKVPEKRLGMGASAGVGEDLAFTVTRRRFGIGLFSLPPAEEGDEDKPGALGKDEGEGGGGKTKMDIDF